MYVVDAVDPVGDDMRCGLDTTYAYGQVQYGYEMQMMMK